MNKLSALVIPLMCLFSVLLSAQTKQAPRETALQYLREHAGKFGLTSEDVADLKVTDEFTSRNNGLTHVWIQQQYLGIPVFNGLIGLHIKTDGQVLNVGHRFVPNLRSKVNTSLPSLSAYQALEQAMANIGFAGFPMPNLKVKNNDKNWIFEGGSVSKSDIPVSICYELQRDGSVKLAWTMIIQQANSADLWNMRVDAQTGQILGKFNQTVYCKSGKENSLMDPCDETSIQTVKTGDVNTTGTTENSAVESYNVFPLPIESPAHGNRQLLTNPADPAASPYGWLTTLNAPGAENTYTKGNNVWAYNDAANDNTGSAAESADGGATLTFDFPFDPNAEPETNNNAAITNLFYMNNMMHDIMYHYGFDEAAGNFQDNNYAHGGLAGDAVQAEALDGGGTDNANFSTPADGSSGRMQMYKWNRQGGNDIIVNAPGAVIGSYNAQEAGTWGAPITTTAVTADVVIANDGSGKPTMACAPISDDANGKIVIIDRGTCQFGQKALFAQNAGAKGVIIANFENATIGMAAGNYGGQVHIPVVMMQKKDADIIRQYAGAGLNISMVLPSITGPAQLDGDFDNGIMSHEYTHGISTRLTGGPANSGCLSNAEEMGEGWSDWVALRNTVLPGDTGPKKRGVGTYVFRQPNDGVGIRRYPYSTDMTINPLTFGSVAENTEVHALGEVWTAMLWDLYWALVEKYGYSADITNKASGNAKALQLVLDGCKIQPCSPGFVDGRNAIIAADLADYNGADTCLISTVFARRGLGYLANQGLSSSASDGTENFDPIPTCVKELKIKKITTTPLVQPNGEIDYTITVTNHKADAVTNVVVVDELQSGQTFVSASNSGAYSAGVVSWNLGTMTSGQVITLTYKAKVSPGVSSLCEYKDPMESDQDNWISFSDPTATHQAYFIIENSVKKVGQKAWWAPESTTDSTNFFLQQYLSTVTITGNKPVLRFWGNFNTNEGLDAGFLEVQDSASGFDKDVWKIVPQNKMIRNPYTGKVSYQTFVIPFLFGWSGNSNGWEQTYVDMSDYAGKKVFLRFHFGGIAGPVPVNPGWYVDGVELIDMVKFVGDACVTSNEGDHACASLADGGVIVDTDCSVLATDEPSSNKVDMTVRPNPATDMAFISLNKDLNGPIQVVLVSADGRIAYRQTMGRLSSGQTFGIDLQNLPAGMYTVRLESSEGFAVSKLVKH